MPKLRSKLKALVPRGFRPAFKRLVRSVDQVRGRSASRNRKGVVLMLHVGRCGSTVLANLLAQNQDVFWDGKLPRKAHQLYGEDVHNLDHKQWTKAQFAISGDRFYGFEFKILEDQYPAVFGTTTTGFLQACREIGVTHYVLLVRKNTLRHVVSHYASKSRGNWHATSGETAQKKEFTLDMSDITTGRSAGRPLVDYLSEVDAAHANVRNLLQGENLLELEYESDIDLAGAPSAYARICAFLGIAADEVEVVNRKMNPFALADVLENYEEVDQALAGTQYAWMSKD